MTLSSRIAGAFLAVAGTMMIAIVADYIATMSGLSAEGATLDHVAAYASQHYDHLAFGWRFEIIAMALIGAAALTLMSRSSRIGWSLTAMGVAVVSPMYPVMIGGYGAVFASPPVDVPLYGAFRRIATEIFYIGNLLLSSGLALAFALEAAERVRLMPIWFLAIAALANASVGVTFALMHFNILVDFRIAAPAIFVAFATLAVFGGSALLKRGGEGR